MYLYRVHLYRMVCFLVVVQDNVFVGIHFDFLFHVGPHSMFLLRVVLYCLVDRSESTPESRAEGHSLTHIQLFATMQPLEWQYCRFHWCLSGTVTSSFDLVENNILIN